jgi:hypothetical protein
MKNVKIVTVGKFLSVGYYLRVTKTRHIQISRANIVYVDVLYISLMYSVYSAYTARCVHFCKERERKRFSRRIWIFLISLLTD